jgi:hypothetical protein
LKIILKKNPIRFCDISHTEQIKLLFESKTVTVKMTATKGMKGFGIIYR